jgi:hypothetical protein
MVKLDFLVPKDSQDINQPLTNAPITAKIRASPDDGLS